MADGATEITALVKQVSESMSEASVRSHRVMCDRPEAKGGSNGGPMGGELLLVGLGGCFMSNLLAAIASRKADITGAEVALRAKLEGTPPRFTEIEMEVSGVYQDKGELENLVIIAERGCIVANTIREAVVLEITGEGVSALLSLCMLKRTKPP